MILEMIFVNFVLILMFFFFEVLDFLDFEFSLATGGAGRKTLNPKN